MPYSIIARRVRGGTAAANTGSSDVVATPLFTLPQKENGDSITWDNVLDKPAEDMFDFRSIPATGGTTHTVTSAAEMNTALTNSVYGDVIQIAAGATITGNFRLPAKTWTSGYITIRTANHASLPAVGTRVGTADAANMATFRCTNLSGMVFTADASAKYYRFIGIIFTNESGVNNPDNAIVSFHSSNTGAGWTTRATSPTNIIFDRCRWKSQAQGQKRGMWVAGRNLAFVDCRFDGFDSTDGGQGQCLSTSEYVQRLHIDNCFLGAASQHLIWGGSGIGPNLDGDSNVWPVDIIVNRCEFKGDGSTTANRTCLYETKSSARVVITACVFKGFRIGVGSHGILLNIGAQGGTSGIMCSDQTIRGNIFKDNDGAIISFIGNNGTSTTEESKRTEFSYNLSHSFYASGGSYGAFYHFTRDCNDIVVRNNTIRGQPHSNIYLDGNGSLPVGFGPRWYNNAWPTNTTYGFFRGGSMTMTQLYGSNNWQFSHNAHIDSPNEHFTLVPGGTPDNTGTNQTLANIAAFGFTNEATNDYSLAGGSPLLNAGSDGRNIGPHITRLLANTSGVETG